MQCTVIVAKMVDDSYVAHFMYSCVCLYVCTCALVLFLFYLFKIKNIYLYLRPVCIHFDVKSMCPYETSHVRYTQVEQQAAI